MAMKYVKKSDCLRTTASEVCRLCVSKDKLRWDVFEMVRDADNIKLAEKIIVCFDIMVDMNDGLPNKICEQCHIAVQNFYNFRQQVKSIDVLLREQLLSSQEDNENISDICCPMSSENQCPFKSENEKLYEKSDNWQKKEAHFSHSFTPPAKDLQKVSSGVVCVEHTSSTDHAHKQSSIALRIVNELQNDWFHERSEGEEGDDVGHIGCPWRMADFDDDINDSQADRASENDVTDPLMTTEDSNLESVIDNCTRKQNVHTDTTRDIGNSQSENLTPHGLPQNAIDSESEFVDVEALSESDREDTKVEPIASNSCTEGNVIEFPSLVKNNDEETDIQLHAGKVSKTDDGKWVCNICNTKFNRIDNLKVHIKRHFLFVAHQCIDCGTSFTSATALESHQAQHVQSSLVLKHTCEICHKSFCLEHLLKKHYSLEHKAQGNRSTPTSLNNKFRVKCGKCIRVFHTSLEMEEHYDSCDENIQDSCSSDDSDASQHQDGREVISKTDKIISCTGVSSNTIVVLPPKTNLVCYICNLRFYSQSEIMHHSQTAHNSDLPFRCSFSGCNRLFSDVRVFRDHKKIHRKSNRCKTCKKCFLTVSHLIDHQRTHTGEKPFKCEKCEKCFGSRNNLREHMKTHDPNRVYKHKCGECGLGFNSITHLRIHISAVHKKEKYMCHVCGKEYASRSYLVVHIKKHNAPQFNCSLCNYSTFIKSSFERHLYVHEIRDGN